MEDVTLSASAQGSATYDQTGTYAILYLAPTKVQGHIIFSVTVTVQDKDGSGTTSQSQVFTLDTQILTEG
jgi:hypothetical protein